MTPMPWIAFLSVCAQMILFACTLAIAFVILGLAMINVVVSWRRIADPPAAGDGQ